MYRYHLSPQRGLPPPQGRLAERLPPSMGPVLSQEWLEEGGMASLPAPNFVQGGVQGLARFQAAVEVARNRQVEQARSTFAQGPATWAVPAAYGADPRRASRPVRTSLPPLPQMSAPVATWDAGSYGGASELGEFTTPPRSGPTPLSLDATQARASTGPSPTSAYVPRSSMGPGLSQPSPIGLRPAGDIPFADPRAGLGLDTPLRSTGRGPGMNYIERENRLSYLRDLAARGGS